MSRHSLTLVLVFLLLACAGAFVNLIGGVLATHDSRRAATLVRNDFASPGVVLAWPAATPGPNEWPAPRQVQEDRTRRARFFNVFAGDGPNTTHQMMLARYGWPLPVLERVQLWWPWDDPEWPITAAPDSGYRVKWSNLLAPPFALALLVVSAIAAPLWLRERWRMRRGRCVRCGYILADAERCAECGLERSR